jgi:hypothetical protein
VENDNTKKDMEEIGHEEVCWISVARDSSSLMMEAVRTSETSVDNHFTRQYNPEDSSEHGNDVLGSVKRGELLD